MEVLFKDHVLALVAGVGAVGLGYLLSRVSAWTAEETEHLKHSPRYYNFSKLNKDLSLDPNGVISNVFVEGTVRKEGFGGGLYSESAGVEGPAKLTTTRNYFKVYNPEKENWTDRSETVINQNLSVPFKLSDRNGNSITIENVHNARNFQGILNLVYQTKTVPEKRTIGDHATNMVLREIPNGSLTREYLLMYGTRFAALGDAVQISSSGSSFVVFHPQEVSSSISHMISHRELVAQIESIVSIVLMVGGSIQIAIQLYLLYKRRRSMY